jgi:membrane protein YqaA with SNARE-associated domain
MGKTKSQILKLNSLLVKNKEKIIKYFFIFLSIAISFLIFVFRDALAQLSSYGYFGIFIISAIGNATIIIPAPVVATALIGGSIYNPYLVGAITALGATIGELTGYLAGEGSQAFIEQNKNYQKVSKWMQKSGFLTLFVLGAVPNPLFDLAGIVSGATNYPIKRFLLSVFLGKTLKFLILALLGKSLL